MSLSTRLHTSWQLLQRSLRVLRDHPKLVLFPILSAGCSVLLVLFFLVPVFALRMGATWAAGGNLERFAHALQGLFYAYGAIVYLGSMFAATFFNVAFYHQIMRAFAGDRVSLGDGLTFALRRVVPILTWSLLAGSVGLLIRAIEERLGWFGRMVMALLGTVWSVATVFAIPVIIRRPDPNPLAVLRDSAATLRRTWGESLAGFVGLRLGAAAIVLLSLGFGGVTAVAALLLHQTGVAVAVAGIWLALVLVAMFVVGIATHVYRCALYVYASEGVVPGGYTVELMDAGWKVNRR